MNNSLRTAPPPRPSDTGPYKPISVLAVAALLVAVLNALLLIGFGIAALAAKRPFLSWAIVMLSLVAVGLSIAAKLQLSRAQGTRAGHKLATAALMLSLVFGLGYTAYWFAIDFSIRKQGQEVAERFLKLLGDSQPERAFMLTKEPLVQKSMPDDPDAIRKRFGNTDLNMFNRSEVSRLFRAWPSRIKWTYEGVHSWTETPMGFECELNYTIRVPEGVFPVGVTALGVDDPETGERFWQISFGSTGVRGALRQFTTLGKLIVDIQYRSLMYLKEWPPKFIAAGAAAAEPMIRIEGAVPPPEKRKLIAEELMDPNAVKVLPGGPTRPLGNATVLVGDGEVLVMHVLEISAPSVGSEVNALLAMRVQGDELVKEMRRLAGPDWDKQPVNLESEPELSRYQVKFEPFEINIRPSSPKTGPRPMIVEKLPIPSSN